MGTHETGLYRCWKHTGMCTEECVAFEEQAPLDCMVYWMLQGIRYGFQVIQACICDTEPPTPPEGWNGGNN